MGVRLRVRSGWTEAGPSAIASYEFDQGRILLGRGAGVDVRLPHRAASLRHATLEVGPGGATVTDLNSTNGTRVNGVALVPGRAKTLQAGDRVEVGGFFLEVEVGVPVARSTDHERTASLARRLARAALAGEAETMASLIVLNGPGAGTAHSLPAPPASLRLGRDPSCEVSLDDADASRVHAALELSLDGALLRDLDSKNGIEVGGAMVEEAWLADGVELRVGGTRLRYEDRAHAVVEATREGDDEAVTLPVPPQPEPDPEATPGPDVEEAPSRRSTPAPPGGLAPADVVVYVLAAVVLGVSLVGLAWLFRG